MPLAIIFRTKETAKQQTSALWSDNLQRFGDLRSEVSTDTRMTQHIYYGRLPYVAQT